MTDKIQLTETQLMVFDMLIMEVVRYAIGEFKKVMNASDEELNQMKDDINKRFSDAMNKIKQH